MVFEANVAKEATGVLLLLGLCAPLQAQKILPTCLCL